MREYQLTSTDLHELDRLRSLQEYKKLTVSVRGLLEGDLVDLGFHEQLVVAEGDQKLKVISCQKGTKYATVQHELGSRRCLLDEEVNVLRLSPSDEAREAQQILRVLDRAHKAIEVSRENDQRTVGEIKLSQVEFYMEAQCLASLYRDLLDHLMESDEPVLEVVRRHLESSSVDLTRWHLASSSSRGANLESVAHQSATRKFVEELRTSLWLTLFYRTTEKE